MNRLDLRTSDAVALGTAVLHDDAGAFGLVLADDQLAAEDLAGQLGVLLYCAAAFQLGTAGLAYDGEAVARQWDAQAEESGCSLGEMFSASLQVPLDWLDAAYLGRAYVPASDLALTLACGLQVLAWSWLLGREGWARFCYSLAASTGGEGGEVDDNAGGWRQV